jgi:hypothetical protein
MIDCLIGKAWWGAVMSLVFVTAIGALMGGYRGTFAALSGDFASAGFNLLIGAPLGVAAWLLCRHRADLICD